MPALSTDYRQNPDKIVLDLINHDNETNLLLTDVTFGTPVKSDPEVNELEVTLRVNAANGSIYSGYQDVIYNRVRMSFTVENEPGLQIEIGEETTVHDLLPALNNAYGVQFTTDDLVDGAIPSLSPGDSAKLTLQAKPGSLVFYGEQDIDITMSLIPLDSVITVTTLDGLYNPPPNH